jgi:hypothetical protein
VAILKVFLDSTKSAISHVQILYNFYYLIISMASYEAVKASVDKNGEVMIQ